MTRREVVNTSVVTGNQTVRLTYFTARKSETVTQLRLVGGATAAGATPTLVRAGVYSVAANGDLTLVGGIANDPSLFAAVSTSYVRALTAPFDKVAGQRYAVGVLVVSGATTPTLTGHPALSPSEAAIAPRIGALLGGQSDLPAFIAAGALGDAAHLPYVVLLP